MNHRERLLVETDWLAEHLQDPRLRIVDIRGEIRPPDQPKPWYRAKREEYLQQGHIPGAIFIDWLEDIVEPETPVPMTVASPPRFQAMMERLGIGASLGLFTLKLLGYPAAANFAGSWNEWERDPDNPTETG